MNYPTQKDALQALADYNANPYDIAVESITFSEVYEKWPEIHFKTIVPSACRTWKSAYKCCKPLYDMRMKDIRVNHLEQTIKDATVGDNTKSRMKSLFNLMYKYAMKHEIVRIPFTDQEIQQLWDDIHFPFADMVMIGIYTGFRPQELAILKIEDVDLEQQTITGGLKTDAGKNRVVPIHPVILELVKQNYQKAKAVNMNEYILKLIVGHAIDDITEKTYTHRTIEDLHREIQKIK